MLLLIFSNSKSSRGGLSNLTHEFEDLTIFTIPIFQLLSQSRLCKTYTVQALLYFGVLYLPRVVITLIMQ